LADLLTEPLGGSNATVTDTADWTAGSGIDLPDRAPMPRLGPADREDLTEIEHMHRRDALRVISMVGALLALPPAEEEPEAVTELKNFAQLNTHLWQVFALASCKAEVLPLVRSHQHTLATSLAAPQGPATRQRLCVLNADLYQLAGEIHFDRNAYTDAAHCYTLAAEASKDAKAFDLWACAMTRHAFLSVYERQFDDAKPMLELASALARRGDPSLSTRYWVAAVQAETFAGLGDLDACQRALDTAEQVTQLTGPKHNGGWLRF
ncbi:hypothetical protein ACFQ1S_35105, partial [Kibdelosporangium lantanae]